MIFHFSDDYRPAEYFETRMGNKALRCDGFIFTKVLHYSNSINWRCSLYKKYRCKARGVTENDKPGLIRLTQKRHTHEKEDYVRGAVASKSKLICTFRLPPINIITRNPIASTTEDNLTRIHNDPIFTPEIQIKEEAIDD
jgi:hypothetical protein